MLKHVSYKHYKLQHHLRHFTQRKEGRRL